MPSIREQSLIFEQQTLSERAFLCINTKGRLKPEKECLIRTAFQRDRDRIIHSNAFRRLKDKTQVFLSPEGDHYRTRLTHTLEVSQIARTITRALRLNEDLTEAIALGHDLGHTPFGHAGERALDSVFDGGFKHYEQSLRVVDFLEREGQGLNLSYEVRDGILCHTSGKQPETLEGRVVRISDKIAYINHDIEDGVRAGIMSEDDIPKYISNVLGRNKSDRIDTLVMSLIENSKNEINFSQEVLEAFNSLHDYMFSTLYVNPKCKGEEGKAVTLIKKLYEYYCSNPDQLPEFYRRISINEGVGRAACDYISGMSDRYAKSKYTELFIPHFWED